MLCKVEYRRRSFDVEVDPAEALRELANRIQLVVTSRMVLMVNKSSFKPLEKAEHGSRICGVIKGSIKVFGQHLHESTRRLWLDDVLQKVATSTTPAQTTAVDSSLEFHQRLAADPEVVIVREAYKTYFRCKEVKRTSNLPCKDYILKSQSQQPVFYIQLRLPGQENFLSYTAVRDRLVHLFCHFISKDDVHGASFHSSLQDVQVVIESVRILQHVLDIEKRLHSGLSNIIPRRSRVPVRDVQVFRPSVDFFADVLLCYGHQLLPFSLGFLKHLNSRVNSAKMSTEAVAILANTLTAYLAGNEEFLLLVARQEPNAVPHWLVDITGIHPLEEAAAAVQFGVAAQAEAQEERSEQRVTHQQVQRALPQEEVDGVPRVREDANEAALDADKGEKLWRVWLSLNYLTVWLQ